MGSGSVELGWRDLRPGTVGKWEDTGSRLDFFSIFYFQFFCYLLYKSGRILGQGWIYFLLNFLIFQLLMLYLI